MSIRHRMATMAGNAESLRPAIARVSEAGIRIVIGTLSSIVITRHLSKDNLAQTAYVASLVAIGLAVASLGLDQTLIRYLRDPASTNRIFRKVSLVRLTGVAVVAITLLGYIGVSSLDWQAKLYGFIFTFTLISSFSELNVIIIQRFVGTKAIAKPRIWGSVLGSVCRAATVVAFPGKLVPFALAALVEPVWVYAATRRTVDGALVTPSSPVATPAPTAPLAPPAPSAADTTEGDPTTRHILKFGFPYFLSGLAIVLYMKIDIVLLHLMVPKTELARYVVAARISELFYFIPTAIYGAIAPEATRRYAEGPMKALQFLRHQCKLLLAITGAIVSFVLLFGRPILAVIAGDQYRNSYPVLCVHVLAFFGVSIGVMRELWVLLDGNGYLSLINTALGAVLNIVLNIVLDRKYGAMGAAIATTAAYSAAGFVFPFFTRNGRAFFLGRAVDVAR
jgi:O-antigen/teichoic acid export membrane protein